MTHIEFKQFLNGYKTVSEIVKKVIENMQNEIIPEENSLKGWSFQSFHISKGHIIANLWSGEYGPMEEVTRSVDITKEVVSELMPDDLIF